MTWYKKLKERLLPSKSDEKKDVPEGVWTRCPSCKKVLSQLEMEENWYVCPECTYHFNMPPEKYFKLIFDNQKWQTLFENISSIDVLNFYDRKPYKQRLLEAAKNSGSSEAITIGYGKVADNDLVIACMNFKFIGGSMGSVVGERFARAVEFAAEKNIPLLAITQTGGARMMESAFSLMQMAKTSAVLDLLWQRKIPYWVLLTNPTTGGVTASFGMLGDIILAEPGALIGFAGPRVIRETIKRDLPEGFQRSEFLLEHGFVDKIVDRRQLKQTLIQLYELFKPAFTH